MPDGLRSAAGVPATPTAPQSLASSRNEPAPPAGFHGISYAYLTREAARMLGKSREETNLIICHLGVFLC